MYVEQIAHGEETPAKNPYDTLIVTREGKVGLITLNRPKALNALNSQLIKDVPDVEFKRDGYIYLRSVQEDS